MVDKPPQRVTGLPEGAETTAAHPTGTAAANGHWQHDSGGPRLYVPPVAADGVDLADASARAAAVLDTLGPDISQRVHLTLTGEAVVLTGTLNDAAQLHAVEQGVARVVHRARLVNNLRVATKAQEGSDDTSPR
ncbi:hypothetical protein [Pseudotabrizicola algicola]|uniref:BON domain-containing protein n=1 Tax=Pseudotabrizicola algicola TaxID=2709381 RepID=A0A6B3RTV7_9RHOB|nr:hypothetical protein [Pseudotabrizicola algicola]NEX46479.1 hypothetical protein [Pseudotabrizicola algicola]